jgi:hypothetical protein
MKHLQTFEYYIYDPEDDRTKPESGQNYSYNPNIGNFEFDNPYKDKLNINKLKRLIEQFKKKIDQNWKFAAYLMSEYKSMHPELKQEPYKKLWNELISYWIEKKNI